MDGERYKMNWRKEYVRTLYKSVFDLRLKKKLSKGLFKGKKAYIIAAAPSLNHVDFIKLKKELKDNLVIVIKQSVLKCLHESDFMLINFCNLSDYPWDKIQAAVFWTTFEENHRGVIHNSGNAYNEIFEAYGNGANSEEGFQISTAGSKSWEDLLNFEEGKAKWGPGLMYELAIPLALHLGVEEINLVAWDIGKLSGQNDNSFMNEHFYESNSLKVKTKINDLEIKVVAKSTESLNIWLKEQGVALKIISNSSLTHESVERDNKWLV